MTNFVAVLMGSDSDLKVMQNTLDALKKLDIPYEVKVSSAHRTPQETHDYVINADKRGCQVFIAAAGLAAHLAGAIAANTTKPVIGVPMDGGPLNGFDALLSTVQMPAGVPVATVAIGKAGAINAAFLAAQMLALSDSTIAEKLKQEKQAQRDSVLAKNEKLMNE